MGKGKRLRSVSAQSARAVAKRELKGLKGGLVLKTPLSAIKAATPKGPIVKGVGVDPKAVERKLTKAEKLALKRKEEEGAMDC